MGAYPMILVSILEGKNFPVRNDKKLIVEAKFDGEVMGTEPVAHTTYPQIQTEFAWEVDKKGLQMHRLQRTPIKLLWYAIDLELTRKEMIGYIILDIRLAHDTDLIASWYPLLNCKYHREKPEVLIKLGLEKENNIVKQKEHVPITKENSFNGGRTYSVAEMKELRRQNSANSTVPKVPLSGLSDTSLSNVLEPELIQETNIYHIGPPELCCGNFVFSVTLAFAANLNKLAHPSQVYSSKDFYFYYSLFKNDVMTEKFTSLLNPDFRPERASVKIFSSADLLSTYFRQHPQLELFLYCSNMPLASGIISLRSFASVDKCSIEKEPICVEDNVQLHPVQKFSKMPTSEDLSPFVGVNVVLQKDMEQHNSNQAASPPAQGSTVSQPIPASQCSNVDSTPGSGQSEEEINGNHTAAKDHNGSQNQATHSKAQLLRHHSLTEGKGDILHNMHSLQNKSYSKFGQQFGRNASTHVPNGHPSNDNVPCHFCFSLELCNFRATRLEHPVNIFIRYSYPFFGGSAVVATHPEVEVYPSSIVSIPDGYCSFNFAATLGALKATFYESPLILEILHRRFQGSKQEQLIGTCRINLSQIFNSAVVPHVENKKQSKRQMCNCTVKVTSVEGQDIGELTATMVLDDFGPTSPVCEKNVGKLKTPVLPQLRNSLSSFDVPSMRPNGYRQEELAQAAYDIELWKQRQREIFRAEMKEKETRYLKLLLTDWKQREAERELILQRKLHDYQKMEEKLKLMVQEAQLKESQASALEKELNNRLQNLDTQMEQREKEMNLKIEKIRMEYEDMLRVGRLKQIELEENISSLQRKVHEKELENRDLKSTVETLRVQSNKQPDVELKTENNILKMEKAELHQKFEAAAASKQKYKLLWGEACRQVSILQHRIHSQERLELIKKDEELASLQQRIHQDEEEKRFQHPDKQSSEPEQESPCSQSASESLPATTPLTTASDSKPLSCRAQQLTSQRDSLLKSGMYKDCDNIIKALNCFIEKAKQGSP